MGVVSWYCARAFKRRCSYADKNHVVPRTSAVVPGHAGAEPICIHADHRNMVKYSSCEDHGYKAISQHLMTMAMDAPKEISKRWGEEKRVNEVKLGGESTCQLRDLAF